MEKRQSTFFKIGRLLSLSVAIVFVWTGSVYGADSIDVPSITPLSEKTEDLHNKRPGIAGARTGFIERFGDNRIVVICDATKRFASGARFYRTYKGTPIYLDEIKVGTYVGYTVNDQAEINMMWIAE